MCGNVGLCIPFLLPSYRYGGRLHFFIFFYFSVDRDSLLVAILNCLTSLFAGFVIFAIVGFMAHDAGKEVDQVVTQGMISTPTLNKCQNHPIRVVEQGDYHVIVVTEYSGVQHPMISMLFIPYRISEYPLS